MLTHHKCATSFLKYYVEEFASANGLSLFYSHYGTAYRAPDRDLTYITNSNYAAVSQDLSVPTLHVVRNPMDLLISAYWSHYKNHSVHDWPALADQRDVLQGCSFEEGLFLTLAFLERGEFYPDTPGPLMALRSWRFDDPRIHTVRMEDMVQDVNSSVGAFLGQIFGCTTDAMDPERFTFERMSGGRKPGEVDTDSHYRAGLPDEWRTTLPPSLIAYIRAHYRDLLERYYPEAMT